MSPTARARCRANISRSPAPSVPASLRVLIEIVLPASMPYLLAGFRLAAGRALIGAVVAEFFLSIGGLGYYILYNSRSYHHNEAFVGVLLLAAFGVGFELLVNWSTRRFMPWYRRGDELTPKDADTCHPTRLLKAAIAHWGARFVANGVVLTDFEDVTGALTSYDDWCRAWSARAAHHEQIGREALAGKHFLTAGECLQRAGVYYHFALVPVRARPVADEGRAQEADRMPPGGAAASAGRRASASKFPIRARRWPASCASPPASTSRRWW